MRRIAGKTAVGPRCDDGAKRAVTFAAALVLVAGAALADEIRFSDPVQVEDLREGRKVVTTRARNEGSRAESVYVTSGGIRYNAGELKPGDSATVTVVEQRGKSPVIVFSRDED